MRQPKLCYSVYKIIHELLVGSTFALEGCFQHVIAKEAMISATLQQFAC